MRSPELSLHPPRLYPVAAEIGRPELKGGRFSNEVFFWTAKAYAAYPQDVADRQGIAPLMRRHVYFNPRRTLRPLASPRGCNGRQQSMCHRGVSEYYVHGWSDRPMISRISAGISLPTRAAEATGSAALLFHGHIKVEDVPIRVTDVKGAMAPRLGRQLLNPLQLQAL
jgi:hypothetical protein